MVSNLAFVTFLLAQKSHQKRAPTKPTSKYFCRTGSNAAKAKYFAVRAFLGCQPHPFGGLGFC
jgi:hypothetical protein